MKRLFSLFLIFVLCFMIVTVPLKTEASAVATVAIAATAVIVIAMGFSVVNQGDFRAACEACADSLTDDVKDAMEDLIMWEHNSLVLTAFVASSMFDKAWSQIKEFFSSADGVIELPVEGNEMGDVISPFPNAIPLTVKNSAFVANNVDMSMVKHINTAVDTTVSVVTVGGGTLTYKFTSSYRSNINRYILRVRLDAPDPHVSGTVMADFYDVFLAPCTYDGKLFVGCFGTTNGSDYYLHVPSYNSVKSYASACCVDSVDFKPSVSEVNYSTDASAIPDDAVKDAFKTKATSAGGVQIGEDSKIMTEVFGDTTTADDAMETTQTDALTETGVIDAVDTLKYPILEDYKAVSGDLTLKDIFPFCIPFDLYNMVSALSAAREAPHIEWRMNVPNVVDYTFEIDFSEFESAAQILRTMELLAFCVGLAFVTRNLLRS